MFKEFTRCDVIFLHAPSIYDFRKETALLGPVNDVVPSTSVFEMYPVGITSLANTLEEAGFNVRIINLAYRMLRNSDYDVEEHIRTLNPRVWAIDLHWMPHVQGVLAITEIIKKYHPETPILMGGLSSSYFHEELVRDFKIDFVMRGDSTEIPVLRLMEHLRTGAPLDDIPNLTWRKDKDTVVINPLTYVPDTLDDYDVPAYSYMMRSVFKYRNLYNAIPYVRWLEYPMTMLLISRGCTYNCSICGGSRSAYERLCNRKTPAYRSPEKLVEDIRFINRFSKAPIFIINDLRMQGMSKFYRFLDLLKPLKIKNEIVFELFSPAGDEFFQAIQAAVPSYSLEFTLETHDPELRRLNGKFPVENIEIEKTLASALNNGCNRIDLFFMTGIPHQTRESVLATVDYAQELLEKFGTTKQLNIYVAPLAPFLDPGCLAFEDPDKYGYEVRARTVAGHRDRMTKPTWSQILNYNNLYLPSEELAQTTYEANAKLARIKQNLGLMPEEEAKKVIELTEGATRILNEMREVEKLPEPERTAAFIKLKNEAGRVNQQRVYKQTDFVSWGGRRFQLKIFGIMGLMIELWFKNASLIWKRLKMGMYRWAPEGLIKGSWVKPKDNEYVYQSFKG